MSTRRYKRDAAQSSRAREGAFYSVLANLDPFRYLCPFLKNKKGKGTIASVRNAARGLGNGQKLGKRNNARKPQVSSLAASPVNMSAY